MQILLVWTEVQGDAPPSLYLFSSADAETLLLLKTAHNGFANSADETPADAAADVIASKLVDQDTGEDGEWGKYRMEESDNSAMTLTGPVLVINSGLLL